MIYFYKQCIDVMAKKAGLSNMNQTPEASEAYQSKRNAAGLTHPYLGLLCFAFNTDLLFWMGTGETYWECVNF